MHGTGADSTADYILIFLVALVFKMHQITFTPSKVRQWCRKPAIRMMLARAVAKTSEHNPKDHLFYWAQNSGPSESLKDFDIMGHLFMGYLTSVEYHVVPQRLYISLSCELSDLSNT